MSIQEQQDQGVIPEQIDPTDEGGAPMDQTTDHVARALDLVDRALMYGYQKFGLHDMAPQPKAKPKAQTPIPADNDADDTQDGDEDDTQSFAEGGVVEDDQPAYQGSERRDAAPEGGAIPEPEPETTGWRDAAPEGGAAQPAAAPTSSWDERRQKISSSLQNFSLMDLVRGSDATPAPQVQAAEATAGQQVQEAQAGGKDMSPSDQRLMALLAAAKDDPAQAWGFLQNYRQKFDASRAFAARALDKENLTSAIHATNKAFEHALDGSDVSFSPIPRADGGVAGVTALVTTTGGTPVKMSLSIPQFRALLSGAEGSYDSIMNLGTANTIRQAAQQQAPSIGPGAQPGVSNSAQPRSQQTTQRPSIPYGPTQREPRPAEGKEYEFVRRGGTLQRQEKRPAENREYTLADVLNQINESTSNADQRATLRAKAILDWQKAHAGTERAQISAGARVGSAQEQRAGREYGADRQLEGRRYGADQSVVRGAAANTSREKVAETQEGGRMNRFNTGEINKRARTETMSNPGQSPEETARRADRDTRQVPTGGQQQAPQLPPEAIRALTEGKVTTFKNGQRWTLRGGQPVQVQ